MQVESVRVYQNKSRSYRPVFVLVYSAYLIASSFCTTIRPGLNKTKMHESSPQGNTLQTPDGFMPAAVDSARELLARNPMHAESFDAEIDRVIGDMNSSPDNYEVEDLLGYAWFRYKIIEKFYDNTANEQREGRPHNYKTDLWLGKLMTYFGYTKDEASDLVYEYAHNYTEPDADTNITVNEKQKEVFVKRLDALEGLYDIDPTAAPALTRKWGITAFERYDIHTLLGQLQDPDRARDTLVITPRKDHNGAMEYIDSKVRDYALSAFYVEAGTATELARIGVRLRTHNQSFRRVVVNIHSDGKKLGLSHINDDKPLSVEHMSQERVRQWVSDLDIIHTGAEVVLAACSTGMQGGLQEQVHKIPAVGITHAPTEVAGSGRQNGRFVFMTKDGREVGRTLEKSA